MKNHEYVYVGKRVERPDAIGKVTGETKFVADIDQPHQLYAALLRSPHAYADIVSIDYSEAAAMEGVEVVITGEDEHTGIGHYAAEMPTLAYKRVMYWGEPVVAIAAETLEIAKEACKKVKVEYNVHKPILTVEESFKGNIIFHDWEKLNTHHEMHYDPGTNCCQHIKVRSGNVEEGFAKADFIVEGQYNTSGIQHVCMEPHGAIAQWTRDGLTVWTCAQSPFFMRGQLARAFGLPQNKVRMIIPPIGGGFGNKWELRAEPIVAALAKRSHGRPVKLLFTREDEFKGAYSRGEQKIRIKSGVMKDGRIVAREIYNLQDSGAYVNGAPRLNYLSTYTACGMYKIDAVKIDQLSMITNRLPTSAYRGFGHQEVTWAAECHMDDIARVIGMDRIEFRKKNLWEEGYVTNTGEKLFSVGLSQCMDAVLKDIKWDEPYEKVTPDGKLRGRGISLFGKITGTPSGSAAVAKLNEDGTVDLLKSGTDMGQGNNSVAAIFLAEELQMDISKINVAQVDTLYTPYEKSATGSRLTFHMGRVLIEAAMDIHRQLRKRMADHWGCLEEYVTIENGIIHGVGRNGEPVELSMNELGKARVLIEQDPIIGVASHNTVDIWDKPDNETGQSSRVSVLWMWGANAAQVLVDPKTGKIEVENFAASHDVGQVINEDSLMGQVEGGVLQAIGHTLYEQLEWNDKGEIMNANLADFKIPTMKDAGFPLHIKFVEVPHPEGPYGAKGIGECPVISVASAIGNAVTDATGVRIHTIPIKPDHMYLALKQHNFGRGNS